ncbi:hypothetical protein TY91_02080 [Secundilactobacillus collinoides]|uniref:Uncharacterized protein n=1 Tax=Secundilactobacillus collinoides TaxID=33960 RepID=A0A166HLA9_SECCO|nr:hypothetical protein TY91_02080 [Secundilactobacillus collinoides]
MFQKAGLLKAQFCFVLSVFEVKRATEGRFAKSPFLFCAFLSSRLNALLKAGGYCISQLWHKIQVRDFLPELTYAPPPKRLLPRSLL